MEWWNFVLIAVFVGGIAWAWLSLLRDRRGQRRDERAGFGIFPWFHQPGVTGYGSTGEPDDSDPPSDVTLTPPDHGDFGGGDFGGGDLGGGGASP